MSALDDPVDPNATAPHATSRQRVIVVDEDVRQFLDAQGAAMLSATVNRALRQAYGRPGTGTMPETLSAEQVQAILTDTPLAGQTSHAATGEIAAET